MKTFKEINAIINKKNKYIFLIAIVATIFSVGFSLIVPLFIRFFVDSVLDTKPIDFPTSLINFIDSNGGVLRLKENLWICAVISILLALINAVFGFIKDVSSNFASDSSIKLLKDRLYDHMQKLPFDYLNKIQTGDLLQRCTSDVETIRRFISSQFIEIIRILCLIAISITIMSGINVKLTLLSIISFPIILIFSLVFHKKVQSVFRKSDMKEGELSTVIQENLTGVRVVRAFGREKFELDKFIKNNDELTELNFRLIKLMCFFWSFSDLICFFQIALVLLTSIFMAYNGEITIGTLMLFSSYTGMLLWPVRQLGRILSDFGKMQVSLERVYEILYTPEEQETEGAIQPNLHGDIIVENLSFGYNQKRLC